MEADLDRPDPAGEQRVLGRLEHAHRHIGVASQQVLGGVGSDQFDRQTRIPGAQAGEDRRQPLDGDHLARRHPHHAGDRIAIRGGRAEERRAGRGHRFGVGGDLVRSLGGRQPARRAQEQPSPQRRLELVDVTGDRRLGQSERSRRTAQRPFSEDRPKAAVVGPKQARTSCIYV